MSTGSSNSDLTLGINGLGRIGKLTLWHHVQRHFFKKIVVNIGRPAGRSLEDVAHYIERDSTYGRLDWFLNGCQGQPVIHHVDEQAGTMEINGVSVKLLRTRRNPVPFWKARSIVTNICSAVTPLRRPASRSSCCCRSFLRWLRFSRLLRCCVEMAFCDCNCFNCCCNLVVSACNQKKLPISRTV